MADVALSRTDRVTVSEWGCVQGLERRVVVWLEDWWWEDWRVDDYIAVPAFSRCTTQLIRVCPPRSDPSHPDSIFSIYSTTPHTTDDEDETTEGRRH